MKLFRIQKQGRPKSENDLSERSSADDEKNNSFTNLSSFDRVNPSENHGKFSSSVSSHRDWHDQHQSNDKVKNINSVVNRNTPGGYLNTSFPSTRNEGDGQHRNQILVAAAPSTSKTLQQTHQKQQARQLSRSVDRLTGKSSRRTLRYEEHDDYIPPPSPPPSPPPLNSIQCHPTIDHYARTLNQSSYFYSTHRRSQIEVYQRSSEKDRFILPRPYSSNIPSTFNSAVKEIPISYSHTIHDIAQMSQTSRDDNNMYAKLSDCHSPLIPVENSSVKSPRRIEPTYSQFPVTTQEPVYANTQSLYDNISYPTSSATSKTKGQSDKADAEKKSCASQTQLTWTMATFSSFVDLENQSIIIQQPDPSTLYSIVQHHHIEPPPSASPATIEHLRRISPSFIDNNASPSHYRHPRSRTSSKTLMIEKRDGSFQTLVTIAPTHAIDTSKPITLRDSTPSPLSTGSSSTTDHYHHHHHHHHHHNRHRRHKSQSSANRNNVGTRDVGLQVNIQTVKKITFLSQKSEESSMTTSTPSPPTIRSLRESKHTQANYEPLVIKHDKSTSYDRTTPMVTSASQTLDSSTTTECQTKSVQTSIVALRDQSIETNNRGLFVCDLSSFLKNGLDEVSSTLTITAKQQS